MSAQQRPRSNFSLWGGKWNFNATASVNRIFIYTTWPEFYRCQREPKHICVNSKYVHANTQKAKKNGHKPNSEPSQTQEPLLVQQVWKCLHGWSAPFHETLNSFWKVSLYFVYFHCTLCWFEWTHLNLVSHQQNHMNKRFYLIMPLSFLQKD